METAPSAVGAQSFTKVGYFLRDNLRVGPHEPETTGMKLPERRLRQGEFLRRQPRCL